MFPKLKFAALALFHHLAFRVFASVLVFYFLFGYFAVNPLAQRLLPWVAEKQLASRATVAEVRFDPLRLKTTIHGFQLTQQNGAPLAGFDLLVVDLELSGLLQWAWKFKEISLLAPRVNIEIDRNGGLNWATLIAKLNEDPSPPSDSLARVVLQRIAIHQGQLHYLDAHRATPFKTGISPIDLELDGFSTLPEDRGDYLLAARLPDQGGVIKWKGNMGVNPVASKGAVAVEGLNLARFRPLLANASPAVKLEQGMLQLGFDYDFALVPATPRAQPAEHDKKSPLPSTQPDPPQDQPKIAVHGLSVKFSTLAASMQSGQRLNVGQCALTAPALDFSLQDSPQLRIQKPLLVLDHVEMQQGRDTRLLLNSASLQLPQLDMQLTGNAQAMFADAALTMDSLTLSKGSETLLRMPTLAVNGLDLHLAERQLHIGQVLLPNAEVQATLDKAGVLDWQQAFASHDSASTEPAVTPATVSPPGDTAIPSPPQPWTLDIGDVQMQHWRLAFAHQQWLHPLRLQIADVNLGFAVNGPVNQLAIQHLQSDLHGFEAYSSLTQQPVASLASLRINQGEIQQARQTVQVQSVQLSGLKSEVIQPAGQVLNWQAILAPLPDHTQAGPAPASRQVKPPLSAVDKTEKAGKPGKTETASWSVNVKKTVVDDVRVHVEDRSQLQPVVLDIEKAMFEVRDASLDMARPLPIRMAMHIKQGGQLALQGTLVPSPLKLDARLQLQQLSLLPFSPYVNKVALLNVQSGAFDMAGQLSLQQRQALTGSFKGGFHVQQLAIVEEGSAAPFLGWERLGSEQLELTLAPNQLHMTTLDIVKPTGKIIIHEDKSMNVTRILRQPAAAPPSLATQGQSFPASTPAAVTKEPVAAPMANNPNDPIQQPAPEAFPVSIETVRIEGAELDFADLSLTPQFGTHINSMSGVINGVSASPTAVAQVELDGKVDTYGSARVRGALQPFNVTQFTDLKLSFKNLEMNRLTPYSGKFAGRRIDSGRLSVDLKYNIKQRQLAGQNKFVIQKLKLGERVESKDAADLPLDLAIAILEDSDGVIDLDLPIAGSLDDPQFSYGGIVWKAIKNVLGKIVTAPFRALGKLFGGSGEKLDGITFDAGSALITPPEQEKLASVAQMLSKREKLTLSVTPATHVVTDTRALQEQALRKQVATALGVKLADGQVPGPIDLSNPKTQAVLDDLYNTLTKKPLLKRLAAKLEKPEAGHYAQIQEQLTASIAITEADVQALAVARGEAILSFLSSAGVSAARMHALPPAKVDATPVTCKLGLEVVSTAK